jgi:thiosulfate reductase cytochrome b subunit
MLTNTATQEEPIAPRHSLVVRITHWVNALSIIAFLLSGTAILLAYPRLHWGEAGALGMPSIIDLPLPFVLELGIRGPGRYVHFLVAWIFVFNGLVYLVSGYRTGHFRKDFWPRRADLTWPAIRRVLIHHFRLPGDSLEGMDTYNGVQRLIYLIVVFGFLPFMFISGLAMSPMVTSVVPLLADVLGGQQSARTLHFFVANGIFLFLAIHLAMVILTGFRARVRAMITGFHQAARTR